MAKARRMERVSVLPPSLAPKGISLSRAARLAGVTVSAFERLVADGRMPLPKVVGDQEIWDREAVERALITGSIYVVTFGCYVKIGYSKDVQQRIVELECGLPEKLTLCTSFPGNIRQEKALHRRFEHLRLRGEWFRNEGDLADWVACLLYEEAA